MKSSKRTSIERSAATRSRSRTRRGRGRRCGRASSGPWRAGRAAAPVHAGGVAPMVTYDATTDAGSRCVKTITASGNAASSGPICSRCCGDLRPSASRRAATAWPAGRGGGSGTTASGPRLVRVAPRRQERHRLEEHGREVDGEELDLLVHVVGRHLVHADEVGAGSRSRTRAPDRSARGGDRARRGAGCSASSSTGSRLSQYGGSGAPDRPPSDCADASCRCAAGRRRRSARHLSRSICGSVRSALRSSAGSSGAAGYARAPSAGRPPRGALRGRARGRAGAAAAGSVVAEVVQARLVRAAARSASGSSGTIAAMPAIAARTSAMCAGKLGSARSSRRTGAGRALSRGRGVPDRRRPGALLDRFGDRGVAARGEAGRRGGRAARSRRARRCRRRRSSGSSGSRARGRSRRRARADRSSGRVQTVQSASAPRPDGAQVRGSTAPPSPASTRDVDHLLARRAVRRASTLTTCRRWSGVRRDCAGVPGSRSGGDREARCSAVGRGRQVAAHRHAVGVAARRRTRDRRRDRSARPKPPNDAHDDAWPAGRVRLAPAHGGEERVARVLLGPQHGEAARVVLEVVGQTSARPALPADPRRRDPGDVVLVAPDRVRRCACRCWPMKPSLKRVHAERASRAPAPRRAQ